MALDVGSLLQSCRRKRGREGEGKGSGKVRRGAQLYMKKKSEEIVEGRREVVGEREGNHAENVIVVSLLQNWLSLHLSTPHPNTTDTHHSRFGCYSDATFLCVAPVHG